MSVAALSVVILWSVFVGYRFLSWPLRLVVGFAAAAVTFGLGVYVLNRGLWAIFRTFAWREGMSRGDIDAYIADIGLMDVVSALASAAIVWYSLRWLAARLARRIAPPDASNTVSDSVELPAGE